MTNVSRKLFIFFNPFYDCRFKTSLIIAMFDLGDDFFDWIRRQVLQLENKVKYPLLIQVPVQGTIIPPFSYQQVGIPLDIA